MPPPSRPTLRSIAEALAVNVSTVSRVLNGSEVDGVRAASPATAERIRAYAAEVGYVRDPLGGGLRTRRSGLVAVLVPRLSDSVLAVLVEGIEEAAREAGLTAFVASTHDDPRTQCERVRAALGQRVDGLVIADARLDHPLPTDLLESSVPFVLANRRVPKATCVTADDHAGGRLVAEHLLAQGHRRFGVVAGPGYASTAVERVEGFLETVGAAGAAPPPELVVRSGFDVDTGRAAMSAVLHRAPDVEAVFAVDDYAAIGAASEARSRGRSVGDDLALVGYNDTPIATHLPVGLSSVRHPTHEIGRTALEVLAASLEGGEATSRTLSPTLVVRASSNPDPTRKQAR